MESALCARNAHSSLTNVLLAEKLRKGLFCGYTLKKRKLITQGTDELSRGRGGKVRYFQGGEEASTLQCTAEELLAFLGSLFARFFAVAVLATV